MNLNERLSKLMWSLQALAQPADVQLSLFPNNVHKSDELMLEYDHSLILVKGEVWPTLSPCQTDALIKIDEKMTDMTKVPDPEYNPEEGLRSDPDWEALRVMAKWALSTFNWPDTPPPCDPGERGTTYVEGR